MEDQLALEPIELSEEIVERVKSELEPGERLLWAAKGTKLESAQGDFVGPIIWAVSFWLGCGFLIAGAFGFSKSLPEIVWILALLGIILGFIAFLITVGTLASWGSSGFQKRKPGESFYALTDRRAVLWQPVGDHRSGVSIQSVHPGMLRYVTRVEYPDGFGDVQFVTADQHLAHPPWGFLGVTNVRLVESMATRVLIAPMAEHERSGER